MGHRLTKIYTRTGDTGETGLGDGSRVPKDSLRVHALGEIDELNSAMACCSPRNCPPTLARRSQAFSTTCSTWGVKSAFPDAPA